MALTVGDIRKALAKYRDDTLVAGMFEDDFSPLSVCCPLKARGALKINEVGKNSLFNKSWLKADLTGKKVIIFNYDAEYSNEFWAENDDEAHPYWKPQIDADVQERIRN